MGGGLRDCIVRHRLGLWRNSLESPSPVCPQIPLRKKTGNFRGERCTSAPIPAATASAASRDAQGRVAAGSAGRAPSGPHAPARVPASPSRARPRVPLPARAPVAMETRSARPPGDGWGGGDWGPASGQDGVGGAAGCGVSAGSVRPAPASARSAACTPGWRRQVSARRGLAAGPGVRPDNNVSTRE